eukprot:2825772-Rhodomonas_salina.2
MDAVAAWERVKERGWQSFALRFSELDAVRYCVSVEIEAGRLRACILADSRMCKSKRFFCCFASDVLLTTNEQKDTQPPKLKMH